MDSFLIYNAVYFNIILEFLFVESRAKYKSKSPKTVLNRNAHMLVNSSSSQVPITGQAPHDTNALDPCSSADMDRPVMLEFARVGDLY